MCYQSATRNLLAIPVGGTCEINLHILSRSETEAIVFPCGLLAG